MLWAIDVGNTQTVVGIHNGSQWIGDWRIQTDRARTEDEWRSLLWTLCQKQQIPWHADGFMISSVVPPVDEVISRWAKQDFGLTAHFLRNGQQVQMNVDYDPPHAVGADRIANALGALEIVKPPFIVVDFGTATTLDVVDAGGIDEHGNFLRMHGQRVAISPYIAYSSGPELETSLESLITDDPSPRAWLAATYEAKRDWRPPEYPRQSAAHERDISRTWPPNHWRTSSRQWSDHNAEVSTSWPPSHESGASRDR